MTAPSWSPTDHDANASITSLTAARSNVAGSANVIARSDLAQSSGVRYAEMLIVEVGNGVAVPMEIGCCSGAAQVTSYPGATNNGVGLRPSGLIIKNNVNAGVTGPTYTSGDVVGMVIDLDAHTVKFNKNGGAFSNLVDITSFGPDVFLAAGLGNGAVFSTVQSQDPATYPAGSRSWIDSPQFPGASFNVVAHGDSISLTGAVQQTYLPRLAARIRASGGYIPQWTRCGVNSASWAQVGVGYAFTLTEDGPLRVDPARSTSLPNLLVCFAGTNGIASAHSAATEYASFQTYIAARLAAGWKASEIVVCTMLPRTNVSEVTRSAYNALLIGGAATYGYTVVRLDLDSRIGAAGQNLDTTWFLDGVHPTDAGHAVIAQIIYDLRFPATGQVFWGPEPRRRRIRVEDERAPRAARRAIEAVAAEYVESPRIDADLQARLRRALEARNAAYRDWYMQLLRDAIRRQRETDDEEAIVLLM